MLTKIREAIAKQKFHPGPLGMLVNPFYFARKGLLECIAPLAPQVAGQVLDVGCGSKPYRALFECESYVGMDMHNPGHDHAKEDIDVFYDGNAFPFPAEAFDSVVCFQVLEHVFDPDMLLREIVRVLRPDGVLLLTVPFVWDEHEQPNDFARYSSFGILHLLQRHGFTVVQASKSCADVRALAQMVNAYLFKVTGAQRSVLHAAATAALTAPVTLAGAAAQRLFPRNLDFYLDNVVLARKEGHPRP